MSYDETVTYLFNCAPPFQQIGGAGYKEGLSTTIALDNHLGNPHKKFRTIHIAGTNGKGSFCSMMDSILRESGLKVGLYTSPYIRFFNERMCVDGLPIDNNELAELTARYYERGYWRSEKYTL